MTTRYANLPPINDFDITLDGRVIYSTARGFWIADPDLKNSTQFQNLRTEQQSTFDASADGRRLVLYKDAKWVVIDTLSGNIADVPRRINSLGCNENALMAPNGEMVLINSHYCAYRGGIVSGFISIAALDGSFEEFIVPPGIGIAQLRLVSDDGSGVMFSMGGPDADIKSLYSSGGTYNMILTSPIPEFDIALLSILLVFVLGMVFVERIFLIRRQSGL